MKTTTRLLIVLGFIFLTGCGGGGSGGSGGTAAAAGCKEAPTLGQTAFGSGCFK